MLRARSVPDRPAHERCDTNVVHSARTADDGIVYDASAPDADVLVTYTDGGDTVNGTSGTVHMFCGAAIGHSSKRQPREHVIHRGRAVGDADALVLRRKRTPRARSGTKRAVCTTQATRQPNLIETFHPRCMHDGQGFGCVLCAARQASAELRRDRCLPPGRVHG